MIRDFRLSGERLTPLVWLNTFLLNRGSVSRFFIHGLLNTIGMGRTTQAISELKIRDNLSYELFLKKRYEFAHKISKKWQDLGITAMITPTFPHCSFKADNADDMGLWLEYIMIWNTLNYPSGSIPIT